MGLARELGHHGELRNMVIRDKDGNILACSSPPDTRNFDRMIIRNACLASAELEGISFDGSDLQGSNFSHADLYGANLADANFDSCCLVHADLGFTFMHNVSFRNADLRHARFSLNELGGGLSLYQVDFTDANLDAADFTGAEYDDLTIFPARFDPHQCGLRPIIRSN